MSLLNFSKYLVIPLLTLYWIFGAVLIAGSLWIFNDHTAFLMFLQSVDFLKLAIYIILVTGFCTLLSVWLACYSIFKRSKFILVSQILLFHIVLGFKVVTAVWITYNKERISDLLLASVKYSMRHEYGQISATTVTFDVIQRNVKCCGASGPNDWKTSEYNNVVADDLIEIAFSSLNVFYSIPESCCHHEISDVACTIARVRKLNSNLHAGIHKEGCVSKLVDLALINSGFVLSVFLCVISLDFFFIGFSIVLCCFTKSINIK